MTELEGKVRSVLLGVRTRRLTLLEGERILLDAIEAQQTLVFDAVRLVVTELEREVTWLKQQDRK